MSKASCELNALYDSIKAVNENPNTYFDMEKVDESMEALENELDLCKALKKFFKALFTSDKDSLKEFIVVDYEELKEELPSISKREFKLIKEFLKELI